MDKPLPKKIFVPASQFELYIIPFTDLLLVLLKSTPYYSCPTFGFTLQKYYLLKVAFIETIETKSTASNIFYNLRSTNNKPRGNFVTSIHGTRVFTSYDALEHIFLLNEQGVL